MADQNDLNKPDLTSNYSSEVLETLRGHIKRLWSGDYTGMGNLTAGMRRWVRVGTTQAKLVERNSGGTEDTLFDSSLLAPIASPTFTGSPAAPTPAQFDNDTSLATTAFVQRALGNFSGIAYYSANATIDPSNAGKAVNIGMATAGQTMQLPAANLVPAGATFYIFNYGQAYNLTRSGSDSLSVDGSISTSLVIPIAGAITAISNGGNSWSITGTGVLAYMQSFGASLTQNGYGRQPNGLIEQWGYSVGQSSNNTVVTFPIAFPNALHSVTSMLIGSSIYPATIKTTSNTNFVWERVSGSTNFSICWMAKGF